MTNRLGHLIAYSAILAFALPAAGFAQAVPKQPPTSSIEIELVKLIPSLAWPALLVGLFFWKRRDIGRLFQTLSRRIEAGAAIKLSGVIEVGPSSSAGPQVHNLSGGSARRAPSRERDRNSIYAANRGFMVVHTLHPSEMDNQVYDVLLYLVPKGGSFLEVRAVEYYFGKHWDHLVVSSRTRLNGFAVKVSAYGPFLCVATIIFNDEYRVSQYRFVDFEAPAQQPLKITEDTGSKARPRERAPAFFASEEEERPSPVRRQAAKKPGAKRKASARN